MRPTDKLTTRPRAWLLSRAGQKRIAWRKMAIAQQDIVLSSKSLQITSTNAYLEPQLGIEGWQAFGAYPTPNSLR
jgi:hypothetical protein